MTVIFEKDPTSSDRWLIAEAEGKPQLGAHMPASDGANLTVYWRGHVDMPELSHIVSDAWLVLTIEAGHVQGTLTAYGKGRERIGPTSKDLSAYLAPSSKLKGFDAYRAELESVAG